MDCFFSCATISWSFSLDLIGSLYKPLGGMKLDETK